MSKIDSYSDCLAIFEQALLARGPLRITYDSHRSAIAQRRRFHALRVAMRDQSLQIYPEGHPERGACVYDCFTLSVLKDSAFIDIHRGYGAPLKIEELSIDDVALALAGLSPEA